MADEGTMEPEGTEGQSEMGSETTTQPEPLETEGQSVESGTTDTGHQEIETVYDPAEFKRLTESLTRIKIASRGFSKKLAGSLYKKIPRHFHEQAEN